MSMSEAQAPSRGGVSSAGARTREGRTKAQGGSPCCISMLAGWVLVVKSQGIIAPVLRPPRMQLSVPWHQNPQPR